MKCSQGRQLNWHKAPATLARIAETGDEVVGRLGRECGTCLLAEARKWLWLGHQNGDEKRTLTSVAPRGRLAFLPGRTAASPMRALSVR